METISLGLGHFIAHFQWMRLPFHWEDNIQGLCACFQILELVQLVIHPYNSIYFQICIIYVGGVAGWFNTSCGELIFKWWGSAFHFGDLLEEDILLIILYQPHFLDLYFSVDLKSYIWDLQLVLGVLLKTLEGFFREACIVLRSDIDLSFEAHIVSHQ